MPAGSRHQAEPWSVKGRQVLSSSGKPVATAIRPADARRIVAVVNLMEGVPTPALENVLVRELLGTLATASDSDRRAVKAWLEAARRRRARTPRRRTAVSSGGPEHWPAAAQRIVSAMRAVGGIPTRFLEFEALKEILAVVALAPPADLRVVNRWLRESRRRSGGKGH